MFIIEYYWCFWIKMIKKLFSGVAGDHTGWIGKQFQVGRYTCTVESLIAEGRVLFHKDIIYVSWIVHSQSVCFLKVFPRILLLVFLVLFSLLCSLLISHRNIFVQWILTFCPFNTYLILLSPYFHVSPSSIKDCSAFCYTTL